jgi:hypothetical protein
MLSLELVIALPQENQRKKQGLRVIDANESKQLL